MTEKRGHFSPVVYYYKFSSSFSKFMNHIGWGSSYVNYIHDYLRIILVDDCLIKKAVNYLVLQQSKFINDITCLGFINAESITSNS